LKTSVNPAFRIGSAVALLVVAPFGWPFTIPGILLAVVSRQEYPRYVGSALALLIATLIRFLTGEWNFQLGEDSSAHWIVEIVNGACSWALGSLLLVLSYWLTAMIIRKPKDKSTIIPQ
jgi:hypothetical protein